MGPLDIAAKSAVRESPEDFARLVLGFEPLASASAAESVRVRIERRLDKLLRIVRAGETEAEWLHLELQARWEADVPERTYEYWSLACRDHRPLRSVLICLRPGERQGQPRGEYVVRVGGEEVLRFRFQVIRVWEDLSAATLLASGAPGLLPLVPFARDASPALTEQALRRLDAVEPATTRTELQASLVVLARVAFQDETWLARMPKEQLMSTTTLREITEEAERRGRVEGLVEGLVEGRVGHAREAVLRLLRVKFGDALPAEVERRVVGADLAQLDRWLDRLVNASTLHEVFA
jgi:predicted transposase YdaD